MAVTPATKSIRETELVPRASEIRRLADLINNEKRDFTAAEKESWDKVNAEYESIKARVEIQERAAAPRQRSQTRGQPRSLSLI